MKSREHIQSVRHWVVQSGLPLTLLLAGVIISCLMYSGLLHAEHRASRAKFEAVAEDRLQAIEREIDASLHALQSLSALYAASEEVDRAEFRAFVTPILAQMRQIYALEWIPQVYAHDRRAFEESAHTDGLLDFRFTERDRFGAFVTARQRETYYPIYYIEPYQGHEAALGFDCASVPARLSALLSARDTGNMASTGPLDLVGDARRSPSTIIALPIYLNQAPTGTVAERRRNLLGFVVAALRAEDLIEDALARLSPQWVDLYLRDVTGSTAPKPVHSFASRLRTDRSFEPLERRELIPGYTYAATVDVADRRWELFCAATPEFLADNATRHPAAFLVGGLVLSLFIACLVRTLMTRQAMVARMVDERTEELARSKKSLERINADLQTQIDERRRAEETVRDLYDNAPCGYHSLDENGRFLEINKTELRWLGYERDEVIGKLSFADLLTPESLSRFHNRFSQFKREGAIREVEFDMVRKDGTILPVLLSATSITNDQGQYVASRSTIFDISEHKAVTQQLKEASETAAAASRAKSEFLATMSHELRTPLNGVIGMTELLLGTRLDGQQRRYAWLAKSSGEALLALISDVLDFSKIEAGKLELERIDFNPQYAIENVVGILASRAYQKKLELACRVHPGVPLLVRGDPGRFQQILMNLLSNAIKFTEKGEVVIRATRESETETHSTIRVTVTDTGIGISPDQLTRLFESFSQADTSTTRKFGGTGLGLAIVKRLVEYMGGEIGVDSTFGVGSTFWFTAMFEKTSAETSRRERISDDLRRVRILVVDDNATNREILCEQLEGAGLSVRVAPDAESGLDALRRAAQSDVPFGLALLDWQMPNMDGKQLAQCIKGDPLLQDTILVMLSSQEQSMDIDQLRQSGFAAYLVKPIRESQLLSTLAEALVCGTAQPIPPGSERPVALLGHEVPRTRFAGAHILLAEDHPTSQEVASILLTQAGFQCEAVSDGKRAVKAALSGRFDLILMDCHMPEMDGFEATREIRAAECTRLLSARGHRYIPIVAVTANAIQGDREQCIEAGMDDYVSKPLVIRQLVEVIDAQLSRNDMTPSGIGSTEPGDSDTPLFNLEALDRRWNGNSELIERLTAKFQARAAQEIAQLEEAIGSRDAEAIMRLAHGLKGAASYVEADRVQELAARVETLARRSEIEALSEAFPMLRDELKRLATLRPQKIAAGET